jgi:hypothetical protein
VPDVDLSASARVNANVRHDPAAPDISGMVDVAGSTNGSALPAASHKSQVQILRVMRPTRGVPPPRYDGSAAIIEVTA